MLPSEEIECLDRFRTDAGWSMVKAEIVKLQTEQEYYKNSAIVQGDSVKAARILGIIQGLTFASQIPDELLTRKMKPGFIKKTQEVIKEATESIQSLLKEAFKDFPENQTGRETETKQNGG